jgi:hypothetical protein
LAARGSRDSHPSWKFLHGCKLRSQQFIPGPQEKLLPPRRFSISPFRLCALNSAQSSVQDRRGLGWDLPASSTKTRKELGRNPTGLGLITDLTNMRY